MYKPKGNGTGKKETSSKKTTSAKKPTPKKTVAKKKVMTPAQKKAAIKAERSKEVDRVLATLGTTKKNTSKLSAAQKAKKDRVISSYVNANKRR